jgi:hypothetical protein
MTLPGGYRVNLGPAGGNGRIFVASAVVLTWTRDGDLAVAIADPADL